jgi:1-acyl-sn-glycerol-3-phosphate acyltransferase
MYVPGIGTAMWIANYVPVKRGDKASGQRFLERCAALLRARVWVLIFAEGTRKIDGSTGPLGPFKAGAFKLAIDEGVPVVPFTISGARHLMPAKGFPYLKFGSCRLVIHKPVPSTGKTVEGLMAECRDIIASALGPEDELAAPGDGDVKTPAVGIDASNGNGAAPAASSSSGGGRRSGGGERKKEL